MNKTTTPAKPVPASNSKSETIRAFAETGTSVKDGRYKAIVSNLKQFAANGERIGINFTTSSGKFDGEKERIGFEFTIRGGGFDGGTVTLLTVPKLTERTKLTEVIESILGRELTDKEIQGGLDLEGLIGKECNIDVKHYPKSKIGAVRSVSTPAQSTDALPYGIVKDGTRYRYWGNLYDSLADAVAHAERKAKRPAETASKRSREGAATTPAEFAPEVTATSNTVTKTSSDTAVGFIAILVFVFALYWLFFRGSGSTDSNVSNVPRAPATQLSPTTAEVAKLNVPSARTPLLPVENPTPWKDEEWRICKENFVKLDSSSESAHELRWWLYQDKVCDYGNGEILKGLPGKCLMSISGLKNIGSLPDRLAREITYSCGNGPVCTNALGKYNAQIEGAMRTDKRCADFPDLLQIRLSPASSPEYVAALKKYEKTQNYFDLPESIRFANNNKDAKCFALVDSMRKLENSEYWKTDPTVQSKWNVMAKEAMANKCDF